MSNTNRNQSILKWMESEKLKDSKDIENVKRKYIQEIKGLKKEEMFLNEMNKRIDENLNFFYPEVVSNRLDTCFSFYGLIKYSAYVFEYQRWLAIRLGFIGSFITFFASLFAVIARTSLTGGAAGLSISYSLRVNIFYL